MVLSAKNQTFFVLSLLISGLVVWLWAIHGVPHEDGAILFRYARNLAQTGVITYNPGSPPVEGATSFFWMLLLALGNRLGLDPILAALLLSYLSLAGVSVFLGRSTNLQSGWWLFLLLISPPFQAMLGGFSVMMTGLVFVAALVSLESAQIWRFAPLALMGCLLRPDFVIYLVAMVIFWVFTVSQPERIFRRKFLLPLGLTFFVPGLVYFLWRWNYFGLPLPLPFYVKASGASYNFLQTGYLLRFLLVLMIPTLLIARLASSLYLRRVGLLWMGCLVLFPVIILGFFTLEQNVGMRHYFFILLAVLIWVFRYLVPNRGLARHLVLGWLILFLGFYGLREAVNTLKLPSSTTIALGKGMEQLSNKGKLAVTEAGYLPYYSDWPTLDLWGLNTPELARKPPMPQDLSEWQPDLILVDDPRVFSNGQMDMSFLEQGISRPGTNKSWETVCDNTYLFARKSPDFSFWILPRYLSEFSPVWPQTQARPYLVFLNKTGTAAADLRVLLQKMGANPYEVGKNPQD